MQRIASRKFFRILEDHQLKALIPCFTETATQKLPICYQVSGSKVFTSSSNANYSPNAIQSKIDGANNLKEPNHGGADSENRKKHSLYMLCQTFGLSEDETKDLLTSHPFLKKELLHESASYLPRIGLEKTTFLRCPWLVTMLPGEIEKKLKIIQERYEDLGNVNVGAALLNLSAPKLSNFTKTWEEEAAGSGFPSKFHYLEKVLEIQLREVLYLANLKPFLLTLTYTSFRERVALCLEGGMQKEDLVKNLNVLRTVSSKLRDRIETLQQGKVPVKPWLLSTPQSSFEAYLKNYWKILAGMEEHPNIESLLAARLNCDVSQIQKMITKHPAVKKVSAPKLKAILDYLLIDKKIDPKMIVMRPEIFRHKLETVKERIERLEALGVNYLSLWILSTRDRIFEDYAKRWGREK